MAEMKGISCCGDCGNYNWKKHKCNICTSEGKAQDKFYLDCPLEDVAPIKHGKWKPIEDDVIFECSECGTQISTSWDYDTEDMWNYCPHCSAKMDLESGEGR